MNTGWKTHQPNHQPEPHVHYGNHDYHGNHDYYGNHNHHGNRRQQERPGQQQQAQRFLGPKRASEQSGGEDDQPRKEKGQQLGQRWQRQLDRPENWG